MVHEPGVHLLIWQVENVCVHVYHQLYHVITDISPQFQESRVCSTSVNANQLKGSVAEQESLTRNPTFRNTLKEQPERCGKAGEPRKPSELWEEPSLLMDMFLCPEGAVRSPCWCLSWATEDLERSQSNCCMVVWCICLGCLGFGDLPVFPRVLW